MSPASTRGARIIRAQYQAPHGQRPGSVVFDDSGDRVAGILSVEAVDHIERAADRERDADAGDDAGIDDEGGTRGRLQARASSGRRAAPISAHPFSVAEIVLCCRCCRCGFGC